MNPTDKESSLTLRATWKKRRLLKLADRIARMVVVVAMLYLVLHFVGQRTVVKGISMEPALYGGDQIWVDKLSYYLHDPERFDIIVFRLDGIFYIKRVIALPGERIWISRSGRIYIDDRLLEENYGITVIIYAGIAAEELTLGEEEYFVLGDNRPESFDSRYEEVGVIESSQIVGKAVFRIFPLGTFGVLGRQEE